MCLLVCLAAHAASGVDPSGGQERNVKRLTLRNGLRVILVRNTSAPVVTVQVNVLVGGNEDPTGFPGLAHAQEHMAFRGCRDMTAEQTAAVYAQLGDENNADTQEELTRYYVTVPKADLDVALEAESKCLTDVDDFQPQWEQERGALENEVRQTQNDLAYNLLQRIDQTLFAGTRYTNDSLGNLQSLQLMNATVLKQFYRKWYAPSNEVLIVVGDFDLESTAKTVTSLFGAIEDHSVPGSPLARLSAFRSTHFTLESDLANPVAYIAYRLPGTDSSDFAAATVLTSLLQREEGTLAKLTSSGFAIKTEFGLEQTFREGSVALASITVPNGQSVSGASAKLKLAIQREALRGFAPQALESAKRSLLLELAFHADSISDVADDWSEAVALRSRLSPEEDVDAIRNVSLEDVDRVARRYLLHTQVVTATVVNTRNAKIRPFLISNGPEKVSTPIFSTQARLPPWVGARLDALQVPDRDAPSSDITLSNGIHLLVKFDASLPNITLVGSVKHSAGLQTGAGQEGISQVMDAIFALGAWSTPKENLQRSFDEMSARETAGYQFGLAVKKENFSKSLALMAFHQLHPALDAKSFTLAKLKVQQELANDTVSPDQLAGRALDQALLPVGDPALRRATRNSVTNLNLKEAREYFEATVRPDLTTIVVVGDITPEEARLQLESSFGSWKANGAIPNTVLPRIPANQRSRVHVPDAASTQASVVLAEQIQLNRSEADYYAMMIGTQVLDGGFYASRLYQALRQQTGYVYSVDVGLNAVDRRAQYSIGYDCKPENVAKVKAIIEAEIHSISAEDISPEELHQAKALLLRRLTLEEANVSDIAFGMLERARAGLPFVEPMTAARAYVDLDAKAVKEAFARVIDTRNLVEIVRGPDDKTTDFRNETGRLSRSTARSARLFKAMRRGKRGAVLQAMLMHIPNNKHSIHRR
jgi:zinc protease